MATSAEAFAPAAISNFFTISGPALSRLSPDSDLHSVGALGGGFMLSKGVRTRVTVRRAAGPPGVESVTVDGDPGYDARTTRMAAEMLLKAAGVKDRSVSISQHMEVPVGQGFGASAAAGLSTVNAIAAALDLRMPPADVAYFAHAADILCRTGLGTVSVTYRYGGAGIIVKAGSPGVAEVRQVSVPSGVKIVTASLAPYTKTGLLSSREMKEKVNRLGVEALHRAEDLTIESLVKAGEFFAENLGLESEEVNRLIDTARSCGAIGASQNMVGHAIHALVWKEDEGRVVSALRSDATAPLVGTYSFGTGPTVKLED